MHLSRRRALTLMSWGSLLTLTGCGGGGEGSDFAQATSAAGPLPAATPTPAPTPTPLPSPTPTASPAASLLVQAGDSIGVGIGSGGYAAVDHLGIANMSVFNASVDGRTMATGHALSAELLRQFDTGRRNILLIEQGTNDLGASTRSAADLYFNTAIPFVEAALTAGWTVILNTVLPRWDAAWNGSKEQERLTYNELVRKNSAKASLINDVAASSVMGDKAPTPRLFYPDLLHPNKSGQEELAAILRAALLPILTAT